MNRGIFQITPIVAALSAALLAPTSSHALSFELADGDIKGSFDSTVSIGAGRRMQSPSCSLTGDASGACGASAATDQWSAGDNGNLNYAKGDFYTTYLKGTHELLLTHPGAGLKFMVRGGWMEDFKADDTRRTDLSSDAKKQIVHDRRLLDLWVSKEFSIGDQQARARLGNQVINWGESLFGLGGINATNAIDIQRLLVPGTQIKEAMLPAPMLSLASSVGQGVNVEAYYQFGWNRNRYAPVGGFFSAADFYDKGREGLILNGSNYNVSGPDAVTLLRRRSYTQADAQQAATDAGLFYMPIAADIKPKDGGQYGVAVRYKPAGTDFDLGFYALNYHDKSPVLDYIKGGTALQWRFLENRKLYGISANTQVGNWALGGELSYRPKDAVALTGCYGTGGALDANTNAAVGVDTCPAWVDRKKYQLHLTAMLQLMPSEHGWFLDAIGATSGYLSAEAVVTHYAGVSSNKRITRTLPGGTTVDQAPAAGYLYFLDRSNPTTPMARGGGTATSWGYVVDFNATYDGNLISGWQVTPGVTFSHSVSGDTPTYSANYLSGAKAANFYVLFNRNPVDWQAGINYTTYFGGKSNPMRNVFKDRDFIGVFVSRSF